MIALVTTPVAPPIPPWTVRSSVEMAFGIGRDNFAAFAVAALVFTTPAFVLQMNGVGGIPKLVADILGHTAAYICILGSAFHALDERMLGIRATLWQIHRPSLVKLLILGVVEAVLIGIGAFLIVPAFYLMTIWAVAMPVLLIEETEVGDAFRRSADLTRGGRWRVFGACAVSVLIAIAVFGFVSLVLRTIPIMTERFELQSILYWLVGAVVATCLYPLSAVLYVLLRQEKEELTINQIVCTFH
jgi:hypothetical protein